MQWGLKRVAWLAAASAAALCSVEAAKAADPPPATHPALPFAGAVKDEDLLLFAVQLDDLTLTDGMATYGSTDDPLLPVGEFARLLDLNVEVTPGSRRITGRIGESERALTVDLDTLTARIGPKAIPLKPEDAAVTPTEIYLRASTLQKLLPVALTVDSRALQIKIKALETLPIQARQQRMARDRDAAAHEKSAADAVMKVASPYELFSPPAFDVSLTGGVDTSTHKTTRTYDIRAAGDLGYMDFQGYLGSDQNGKPNAARATFERRSLTGGLLGPLNATDVSFGDVYTPTLALGAHSGSGRGFAFTTFPLEQTSVFDKIDLRGELPIGYDVELYVNDILRGGQKTPVQGRYEFLGVPLVRGINVIRVVSYGPHGERSETVRIVNVSGGQMRKHQFAMEFGVIQDQDDLIHLTNNAADLLTTQSQSYGKMRLVGDFAYGLTDSITVVGGTAVYSISQKDQRELGTFGIRASILGFSTQFDAARDNQGGTGVGLGLAGRVFGASIVGRDSEYMGGFFDETVAGANALLPLTRHSELSIDDSVPLGGLVLPLSLRAQRDEFESGGVTWTAGTRTSGSVGPLLMSGNLDYQTATTADGHTSSQLLGSISGSAFVGYKWQLRGSLDYTLLPRVALEDLSLTADRAINERLAVHLGLGQSLQGNHQSSLQAGATYRSWFGDLSLTSGFMAPSLAWNVSLQLAFGMVYDPIRRRYTLSRPGPASGGSVAFDAFVDRDGDGKLSAGDTPLPKVAVQGGVTKIVTGPNGAAFITGLGASPVARLAVDVSALEDPFLMAPPDKIEFSPRPGKVIRVPYPLAPSGDLYATFSIQRDGKKIGLSAVRVRAVRAGAAPVEAVTEFDGTVGFEHLHPGDYQLELDPDQAARLHMHLKAPVAFKIKGDGSFTPDVAAEVVFDTPPPEDKDAAAPAAGASPPAGPSAPPASTPPAGAPAPGHGGAPGATPAPPSTPPPAAAPARTA